MNPLKIEVTEAMREAAEAAFLEHSLDGDAPASAVTRIALTAAFQHPEFVRQFLACLPEPYPNPEHSLYTEGFNDARELIRASLGRLLGEEGK
jgi:hypothetical protein